MCVRACRCACVCMMVSTVVCVGGLQDGVCEEARQNCLLESVRSTVPQLLGQSLWRFHQRGMPLFTYA